jgi:hypothetical protein
MPIETISATIPLKTTSAMVRSGRGRPADDVFMVTRI